MTNEGRIQAINNLVANLRAANQDIFFQARDIADALVTARNVNGYSDADLFVYQSRGDNYVEIEDRDDQTTTATVTAFESGLGPNHNPLFTGVSEYVVRTTVNGVDISAVGVSTNSAIERAIEQAFEAGYTDGWSDGYDAGYNDGYRDGFQDGVNEAAGL